MTQHTSTLTCPCGATHEMEGHPSLIHSQLEAGWKLVATYTNGFVSLCPSCFEEARLLADQLTTLTGSPFISVSHLQRGARL